jgi:putative chitinase
MITAQLIRSLQPKLDPKVAETVAQSLQAAATRFDITNKHRVAHFLAQLAHESGFRPVSEDLHYSAERLRALWPKRFTEQLALECQRNPERIANTAYGTRLGNTQPGDGYRFRGRGFIQLTGRDNYTKYGQMIGKDLVGNPDLALQVEVSALVAAAMWRDKGCNQDADKGEADEVVEAITQKVNGGKNGLEERREYFHRAQQALGLCGSHS